jgi:iron complex outermembrane receptor protein
LIVKSLSALLLVGIGATSAWAEDDLAPPGAGGYFDRLPIVLTPSRLPQPLNEAPAAVTILDRDLIRASGYRDLARLLRLVPGMQIGQERAGNNWVAYHGMGNDSPAEMQILIDGRAIYSPGIFSGVDWHALPVTIEEIERIEVVRSTNTATYGPNAFLGVINIITRHSSDAPGYQVSANLGEPGIRDLHVDWAGGGDGQTVRMAATSRHDNGYKNLTDSSQVDLFSVRSDHRITDQDELTLRLAGSQAKRGTGYPDSLFGSNQERDWHSRNLAFQSQWRHTPAANEELLVNFTREQASLRDSWMAVGPRPDLAYARLAYVPLNQDRDTLSQSLEIQHRFAPSGSTQVVWGGEASDEWLDAPALFYDRGRLSNRLLHLFANLEWRVAQSWLANIAGTVEKYSDDHARLSPRAFLNWQATGDTTFRAGYARAWRDRNDFQTYCDVRAFDPVDGRIMARPYVPNPELRRPRVDSAEIGYLGRFQPANTTVDLRVFRERITDFVLRTGAPTTPDNPLLATYILPTQYQNLGEPVTLVGLEYQIKMHPFAGSQIILNHSVIDRRTANPAVANRAAPYTASLSWLQDWGGGWSSMATVFRMGPLAGGMVMCPSPNTLHPRIRQSIFVSPDASTSVVRMSKLPFPESIWAPAIRKLPIAPSNTSTPKAQPIRCREWYLSPSAPTTADFLLGRRIWRQGPVSSRPSRITLRFSHHGPICNVDAAREQNCSAQAPDHQGHLPFLLSRRQDRPPGPERVRQIHRAANHGRRG